MWQAEASKIPLWTIGEYLADPINYDPDAAWERALAEVIPNSDDRSAYRKFARTSLGSCLNDDSAPEFSTQLGEAAFLYRSGSMNTAAAKLRSMALEISIASLVVQSNSFSNLKLADESAPWVNDYQRGGKILELVAQNLDKSPNSSFIRELADEALSWRSRVFGDSLHMFLGELADDLNSVEFH